MVKSKEPRYHLLKPEELGTYFVKGSVSYCLGLNILFVHESVQIFHKIGGSLPFFLPVFIH